MSKENENKRETESTPFKGEELSLVDLYLLEKNLYAHRFSRESLRSPLYFSQDSDGGKAAKTAVNEILERLPGDELQILEEQAQEYFQASNKTKTPLYLRNIVEHHFQQKLSHQAVYSASIIQIKMKSALRLLNQAASNLFAIDNAETVVAMRSAAGATAVASATSMGPAINHEAAKQFHSLNFYEKLHKINDNSVKGSGLPAKKEEKILYQIVKDGLDSVMLTIRLQNFTTLPKMLYLKRNDRLIQSFALKEDYAFFQQLPPGLYSLELKGVQNDIVKKISLQLIDE